MPSLEEQETVIQFNRDDKYATLYTSDSTSMTKFDKLCKEAPEFYSLTKSEKDRDGNVVGKFYRLEDKSLISLRSKKVTRELTEEQKTALRERMSKIRNSSSTQASVSE